MTAAAVAGDVHTWMDAARQGDREAFGRLYQHYQDVVFRFVYFRCAHNRHLAEDLTAECFTAALRKIDTFHWQGKDPSAWFITIARNLLYDHYKSATVRLDILVNDFAPDTRDTRHKAALDPGHMLPFETTVAGLDRAAVLAALTQLNEKQRRVIVLRFYNGLNIAETAEAMGMTEGGIKALQYRAVRSLARIGVVQQLAAVAA